MHSDDDAEMGLCVETESSVGKRIGRVGPNFTDPPTAPLSSSPSTNRTLKEKNSATLQKTLLKTPQLVSTTRWKVRKTAIELNAT